MEEKQKSKKKIVISEQAGSVNWKKLEEKPKKLPKKKKSTDYNKEAISEEVNNLSEQEHDSPYPDAFLADVNLLNKQVVGKKITLEELMKNSGPAADAANDSKGLEEDAEEEVGYYSDEEEE